MLTLINVNRMSPPIAPIGLDYICGAASAAGIEVDLLDLCLSEQPERTLADYFRGNSPLLVGISFRNSDDCFYPSCRWFVPELVETVGQIKTLTDSPVALGGVGFSIFSKRLMEYTKTDFGIHGDGEEAIVELYRQIQNGRDYQKVPGLIRQSGGRTTINKPAWPEDLHIPTERGWADNRWYFEHGGQIGLETKRGCSQLCAYCADPLAKGKNIRLRRPVEVADEAENLLEQGIDVLHICDAEFNLPRQHAIEVCREFIARGLGEKIRWYVYLSVVPFDAELAEMMRRAGCAGINFTVDSVNAGMLKTYCKQHNREDIASAVKLCRENKIKAMTDLLLGGPGETPATVRETIDFIKRVGPDCAGAALGLRIYPGTGIEQLVRSEGNPEENTNIRRKYSGKVDFFRPAFYISSLLGEGAAGLVRDLIAGDERFFEPMNDDTTAASTDHNYNDNCELAEAIEAGARGAYWDILSTLRKKARQNKSKTPEV